MKKNSLLAVLLLVQALVAFFVLTGDRELQDHAGIRRLLEFNPEQIDGIRIEDNEGNVAELKRVGDAWLTAQDFPADVNRVDRLLSSLNEMEHGLAVANTVSAAERFEVSKTNFQRHLKLSDNGKVITEFYLGSGAGARRSHVRLVNQEAIYAVTIGSYDLPATIDEWQDKDLLQIEVNQIERLKTGDLIIRKNEQESSETVHEENAHSPEWMLEGLSADETFKVDDFEAQLRNLATLRYIRAFSGSAEDLPIAAEFTIDYKNSKRTYWFYRVEEGNDFWLRVSDRDELFEVPSYKVNPIIDNLTREKLAEKPASEEASDYTAP